MAMFDDLTGSTAVAEPPKKPKGGMFPDLVEQDKPEIVLPEIAEPTEPTKPSVPPRKKGLGYFGELKRPDGQVSTEISIGVNINGKETEIPSLVPTLTKPEIDYLLAGNKPTKEIVQKAFVHAKQRIIEGKSPFAQPTKPISPAGLITRPAVEAAKGLVRGTEAHVIGGLGSMAQWAADVSPLIQTRRAIKAGLLLRKLKQPDMPETEKTKLGQEFLKEKDWLSKKAESWADWWAEQASKGWEAPSPEVAQAKWRDMPITKAAAVIGEAAPSYLSAIAASVLTKNPKVGLLFLSGQVGAGAYRRQRKKGAGITKANLIALMSGAWEYVTEKIPFEEVFKPSQHLFRKMLKVGTYEAAQEFVQGIGENFLDYFGYEAKDLESIPAAVKEGLQHSLDGWIENIVAGFGLGVIGGAAGQVIVGKPPAEIAEPPKPLGQIPVAPRVPAEQMREEYRRGELKPAPTIPEPTPTRPVEAITPAKPTVVEAVAEGKAVSELTLGELKQESARFDKKIETEKARLGKIAPERQIFGGTGIENLSPEDAARMTEINDELSRRTKIYKDEAQERVAIKRQLREEGIEFETKDTTENLKAKLHPVAPVAKPTVEERPRQKDLIGRPVLEGGVAGRQAEFLEKEKYRLPEPDIEGQMKIEPPKPEPELGEREAAVVETGIGDKQRSRLIRGIEKQIREHDVYKETLKGLEYKATKISVGKYYVQTNFKGEVKNAVGNYPGLKFHITYDPHGGKHWDEALMEAGEGGRDIDYFLEQLGQSLEARKTKKGFNVVALEETIERGVPELQILDDIRYGLMEGKSVKEINTNIIEWAKHYDLTETDISDLLIREISDEEVATEREKAKVEDEALEKLEAERLREKGVKSRQEQERLKGIITRQAVKETEVVAKQKQITKLRHDIHAVAAVKGLTQKALSELKLKHVGYRHLTGRIAQKKITVEQLQNLLKAVQKARPKRVGYKRVITLKTENKIQSLKENLIKKAQMTEAAFAEVLQKEIQGRQPKYIDAKNFITETQARDILRRMHDTAEVVRITEPYEKAIRGNSNIANEVKTLDQKIAKTPKRDPYSLESMRYYNQQAQLKTGAPVFYVYQDLIDTHLENSKTRTATLHKLTSGEFKKITKDKDALQRVSDYIASQSKLKGRPEAPADITPEEISLAKKIQDVLEEYRLKVRTAKFFNWYYYQQPIPDHDRYRKEITKAIDIYDSKGHDALIEYLKTQEWGVVKSGYEPLEVLFQKIRPYRMKPTTVGKGHIKIRTDIEYHPQERTILQRLSSYMRQMDMLSNLSPKINAYVRLYDDNMSKFNKPEIVRQNTELFLQNLKRYNIQRGWFERQIARAYSQAMRVIIMPSPVLAFRNLFQNAAFEHDKSILIDPRNKKLADEDIDYLETYVLQTRMMVEEYFMVGEKPYLGLRFLTKLIDKIKLYPHSDIANRHWSFWAKKNQVDRALQSKTTKEMMQQAKFKDMTELEQRRALAILAKDGKDAMARYVARTHVDDIHFLYERSQRSPAEMGGVGRIMANLMLFPRAYTEKLAHATSKMMNKKSDFPTRYRGLKILFAVIAGGMLAGAMYRKVTGRRRNPYDPLELLRYEAGGLAWGAVESANQVYINILLALKGDSRAMAALTTAIPEAADMFIPFYNYVLRGIEAATDQKNVDRKVLRQLRMLIDKEYKIRGGAYKLERKTLEKWQYFIAGAGVDVEIKERQKKPAGRIKPMQKIQRIKRVR